jgi:hypothetical protein
MPKVGVFAAIFDEDGRILLTKIKYGSDITRRASRKE